MNKKRGMIKAGKPQKFLFFIVVATVLIIPVRYIAEDVASDNGLKKIPADPPVPIYASDGADGGSLSDLAFSQAQTAPSAQTAPLASAESAESPVLTSGRSAAGSGEDMNVKYGTSSAYDRDAPSRAGPDGGDSGDKNAGGDGAWAPGVNEGEPERLETDGPPEDIVVTISAVGDCTLGYDEAAGRQNRFDQVYAANGGDPAYFFMNVLDILSEDDLTIANLETVFTESKKKADKAYRFSGPPEYVRILEEGGVEAVNIANNHMFDFFQKGYDDTDETLTNSAVNHFGYETYLIEEIRGVKVGMAGFHIGGGGWSHKKQAVTDALATLRKNADLVVVSFHWGVEGNYKPSGDQRSLARYAIDNGADLVLGHHPHTLQSIETYNGRTVVYSLGNFCFGGNRNPKDKDSIIYRQSFLFDGESLALTELLDPVVIPVRVSSATDRNDYRPTPVYGADAERIMKKVYPSGG